MSTAPSKRIWFVRIEAVGDTAASTSNKLYRWSSAPAPAWDWDGLYQHCLGADVSITGQSIEPRTGRSSAGGLSFDLNVDLGDPHSVRAIFGRHFHSRIGRLGATLVAAATTVKIPGYSTGNGTVVHIGREAILLGTYSGGFDHYTGCTRGVLGTADTGHTFGAAAYAHLKVKDARRVTLCYYDGDAAGYSDEVEYQSYQTHEIGQAGLVSYGFECDGLTAVLGEATLLDDPWIGRALQLLVSGRLLFEWLPTYRGTSPDGVRLPASLQSRRAAPYGSAVVRGGVATDPAAGDRFYVSVNGAIYPATVASFVATAGVVSSFRGLVDVSERPVFGGSPPEIKRDDLDAIKIREAFASEPGGATNAGAGTRKLPLGSGGLHHPLTIWLQVATSTVSGSNGTHDVGVDFGCRIPASWIDFDSAARIMGTDPEDMRADRLILGREIGKGPRALEYLDRMLLSVAGIQRTEATDGRISFTRITDSDYLTDAVAVGQDQVVGDLVDEGFAISGTMAGLTVTYRQDGTGQPREIPISDGDVTGEGFGRSSSDEIDGSAFSSHDLVQSRGLDHLIRWGATIPTLEFSATDGVNVRSGDSVSLTSLEVLGYDRVNELVTEGVTDSRVLITGRAPDIDAGRIHYSGLHTGIRGVLACQVAPALSITGVATGINVPVVTTGYVGTDHIRGWTEDTDAWAVGDSAVILSVVDLSIKQGGLVVASIATGVVGLTGLAVGVVLGDVIVPDTYASSTALQRGTWEYLDQQLQYEG